MSKHTQGPWKALRSNEDWHGPMWDIEPDEEPSPFTRISAKDGQRVVACHDLCEIKPEDARLMAAAPDLLNALIQMLDAYEIPSVRQQARDAIAKATGG
jgi:hypothetical protein